jgi:hypothetical protein
MHMPPFSQRNSVLLAPDGVGGGSAGTDGALKVMAALKSCYQANTGDCSGFLKAVMRQLEIPYSGNPMADDFYAMLVNGTGGWERLGGGPEAAARAGAGDLVIGALDGPTAHQTHGHVVIVVPGPLNRGSYPTAWWGSLGGTPGKNQTINWAWKADVLPKVLFGAQPVPA